MSASVRNLARAPSSEIVFPSSAEPSARLFTVVTGPLTSSAVVCAVSGEVDLSTAPRLREVLLSQLRPTGPDLVVDLGEVRFFGAAGLGVLVEVGNAARVSGVRFSVVARTRPVLRPLTVTGLDLALDVRSHVDQAPVRGRVPGQVSARAAVEHACRRQARPARSLIVPVIDSP